MSIAVPAIVGLVAGLVQGITGFGGAVIMMVFLPSFFALPTAAGIAGTVTIPMNLRMAIVYRKHVHLKDALIPAALYLAASITAIRVASDLPSRWVKFAFGCFLVLLALYFILFQKKIRIRFTPAVSIPVILFSGICGGLFGIGGPLMAMYYMSRFDDRYDYLATTQVFFMVTSLPQMFVRFFSGILTSAEILPILAAIAAILIGNTIAGRLNRILKPGTVRTATYLLVGISGIINIIGTF